MAMLMSRAISAPVLSDAAGVLLADTIARRDGAPAPLKIGEVYATSLAYDAALKPLVDGAVPLSSAMGANLLAKTATFVAVERALSMMFGDGVQKKSLLKAFLVNGAGLLGSGFAQPYFAGAPAIKPIVAAAAAANPAIARG